MEKEVKIVSRGTEPLFSFMTGVPARAEGGIRIPNLPASTEVGESVKVRFLSADAEGGEIWEYVQ